MITTEDIIIFDSILDASSLSVENKIGLVDGTE